MKPQRIKATREGKAQTENRCVFTGLHGVDGAHLFSCSQYPELSDIPENIFAMVRNHHSTPDNACFDWRIDKTIRDISERLWMLKNMVIDDLRGKVSQKLRGLEYQCSKLGVRFPSDEKPEDYEQLLCGGKNLGSGRNCMGQSRVREVQEVEAEL